MIYYLIISSVVRPLLLNWRKPFKVLFKNSLTVKQLCSPVLTSLQPALEIKLTWCLSFFNSSSFCMSVFVSVTLSLKIWKQNKFYKFINPDTLLPSARSAAWRGGWTSLLLSEVIRWQLCVILSSNQHPFYWIWSNLSSTVHLIQNIINKGAVHPNQFSRVFDLRDMDPAKKH